MATFLAGGWVLVTQPGGKLLCWEDRPSGVVSECVDYYPVAPYGRYTYQPHQGQGALSTPLPAPGAEPPPQAHPQRPAPAGPKPGGAGPAERPLSG